MATAVTFTSLIADLKNYPHRGSASDTRYNDQLPRLIQKAEARLAQDAKVLINRVPIAWTLSAGLPTLEKPAYWRSTVSFLLYFGSGFTQKRLLIAMPKEAIDTYWSSPANQGIPRFYADYDEDHWFFAPTPQVANPVEYIVDLQATPLDQMNQTNFWTRKAPNLLLDAAMLEAAIFLKNADDIGMRRTNYQETLGSVLGENISRKTDRTQRADK